MSEQQNDTGAGSDGAGVWETIAMVITLVFLSAAIGFFAFGIARYGISH
jgi:hypothetical protein